jgi:hypothetical protein
MSQFENLRVGLLAADKRTFPLQIVAKTNAVTLTAQEVLNSLIVGTPTGAANYTLPLATDIIALADMKPGDAFELNIRNVSGGANAITLQTNTGITLETSVAGHTAAQNYTSTWLVVCTGATTLSVYKMGTGAH